MAVLCRIILLPVVNQYDAINQRDNDNDSIMWSDNSIRRERVSRNLRTLLYFNWCVSLAPRLSREIFFISLFHLCSSLVVCYMSTYDALAIFPRVGDAFRAVSPFSLASLSRQRCADNRWWKEKSKCTLRDLEYRTSEIQVSRKKCVE